MGNLSLYFVRHAPVIGQDGVAYGREADIDTNCVALFEKAAQQLPKNAHIWIASEYPRAQKTAGILQKILGSSRPLVIDGAFNEQDFGDLAGQRKSDILRNPANQAYLANRMDVAPACGESLTAVVARVRSGIHALVEKMLRTDEREAIILSHGGVISAAQHLHTGKFFVFAQTAPHLSVYEFPVRTP